MANSSNAVSLDQWQEFARDLLRELGYEPVSRETMLVMGESAKLLPDGSLWRRRRTANSHSEPE